MRVLALDISTSTGFAVLEGNSGDEKPTLVRYGVIANDKPVLAYGEYPWCYIAAANDIAQRLVALVEEVNPDVIVIEETNLGKNRYSQKILEFSHSLTLLKLQAQLRNNVVYVSSSMWRQSLGLSMSKEDKKNNAKLSKAKRAGKLDKKALGIKGKVTKKHIALRYVNAFYDMKLKVKDDDIADAICLALCIFKDTTTKCDGT